MEDDEARLNAKRKHLLSQEALAANTSPDAEAVTHGHRQGNGLRIHGIYFLVVSLAALVLLIVFIAIASAM